MDLFEYSIKRISAGALERASFINQLTKRTIKSMSRSTATRIHLNRWLVHIKTMELVLPFDTFIADMSDSCMTSMKRSPLGATRLQYMLALIASRTGSQILQCVIDSEQKFISLNDTDFHKGVANRNQIQKFECGHWHFASKLLRGDAFSFNTVQTVCLNCAVGLTDSSIRFEHNGALYLTEMAVSSIDHHGNQVTVDRRDPNHTFSERRQTYHHVLWSPHQNLVADYHSSKRKGFTLIQSPWFKSNRRAFGCELEIQVQSSSVNEAAGRVHDALNPSGVVGEYCYFERDGSIGSGFEIVTQPAGLDVHAAKFATFLQDKEMKRGMRSHEGGSCGFHVHVGRDYLTQGQIYRIQSFLNDVRNEHLIKKIARRYQSGYSKFKPDMAKFSPHGKATGDRYEALNVTGNETIEFRLFRGSLRYDSIMAALEFVNAILDFCTPGATSFVDFNALGFKEFILRPSNSADTKYLRSYLSLDDKTDNEQRQAA